jgi:prepilin peptidase CpaA
MILDAIRLLLFPALMAFAASSDLLTMTISNRLSLALAGSFFLLAAVSGAAPMVIALHVAAGLLMLAIGFGCFAMGWIGGGDAKLAAAIAMWFGFEFLMEYLIWASLFGGVLTMMMIQFRLLPLPAFFARQPWIARLHEKGAGVPYGVALAAAALCIYPDTSWMKAIAM